MDGFSRLPEDLHTFDMDKGIFLWLKWNPETLTPDAAPRRRRVRVEEQHLITKKLDLRQLATKYDARRIARNISPRAVLRDAGPVEEQKMRRHSAELAEQTVQPSKPQSVMVPTTSALEPIQESTSAIAPVFAGRSRDFLFSPLALQQSRDMLKMRNRSAMFSSETEGQLKQRYSTAIFEAILASSDAKGFRSATKRTAGVGTTDAGTGASDKQPAGRKKSKKRRGLSVAANKAAIVVSMRQALSHFKAAVASTHKAYFPNQRQLPEKSAKQVAYAIHRAKRLLALGAAGDIEETEDEGLAPISEDPFDSSAADSKFGDDIKFLEKTVLAIDRGEADDDIFGALKAGAARLDAVERELHMQLDTANAPSDIEQYRALAQDHQEFAGKYVERPAEPAEDQPEPQLDAEQLLHTYQPHPDADLAYIGESAMEEAERKQRALDVLNMQVKPKPFKFHDPDMPLDLLVGDDLRRARDAEVDAMIRHYAPRELKADDGNITTETIDGQEEQPEAVVEYSDATANAREDLTTDATNDPADALTPPHDPAAAIADMYETHPNAEDIPTVGDLENPWEFEESDRSCWDDTFLLPVDTVGGYSRVITELNLDARLFHELLHVFMRQKVQTGFLHSATHALRPLHWTGRELRLLPLAALQFALHKTNSSPKRCKLNGFRIAYCLSLVCRVQRGGCPCKILRRRSMSSTRWVWSAVH